MSSIDDLAYATYIKMKDKKSDKEKTECLIDSLKEVINEKNDEIGAKGNEILLGNLFQEIKRSYIRTDREDEWHGET